MFLKKEKPHTNRRRPGITLPLLCLLSFSCSFSYQRPESINDKMDRYESQKPREYHRPELTLLPVNFQEAGKGGPQRGLASLGSEKPKEDPFGSWSNRRVYFLTLLYQYAYFKNFLDGKAPDIKFCPNFHTSLVENPLPNLLPFRQPQFFERQYDPNFNKLKEKEEDLALYPELSLPLTLEGPHPTVWEVLSKEDHPLPKNLVVRALGLHAQKTYEELMELCEYGQGQNYFIFENLISHMKENPGFKESPPSMRALLKLPLLTNMTLLISLTSYLNGDGRRPASTGAYDGLTNTVFDRLSAHWSQVYFKELEKRKKLHLGQ